jgi:hypothetical protein
MFLPVILQKDFGNGAWLFFIICNVVGATAFPFFINSCERSKIFVEAHGAACTLFSVVTIISQLFFIGWVLSYLSIIEISGALLLIGALFLVIRHTGFAAASVVVWGLSLLVFLAYSISQSDTVMIQKLADQFFAFNSQALYVLPLLAFGFLLCPYLDLTFHKVVQAAHTKPEQGNKISFLIGFPLLFAMLMIFSLIYADVVGQILLNPRELFVQHTPIIKALLFYFIMQASFTSMAHWVEMKKYISHKQKLIIMCTVMLAMSAAFFASIFMNETTYRLFMAFYGIIAPAYLWIIAFNKKRVAISIVAAGIVLSLLLSAIPLFFPAPQYYYWYPVAVTVVLITRFISIKN